MRQMVILLAVVMSVAVQCCLVILRRQLFRVGSPARVRISSVFGSAQEGDLFGWPDEVDPSELEPETKGVHEAGYFNLNFRNANLYVGPFHENSMRPTRGSFLTLPGRKVNTRHETVLGYGALFARPR